MPNLHPITLEQISPFIRYVNNYAPTWSYTEPQRVLFDYEFMYVVNGRSHILYDNQEYNLQKGDFFYFRPGIVNQMTVRAEDDFRTHCIHFDWTPPASEEDFSAEDIYIYPAGDEMYHKKVQFLSERPISHPFDLNIPVHIKNTPAKTYELFSRCYYAYLKNDTISRMQLKSDFIAIIALLSAFAESGFVRENTVLHPSISHAVEYIKQHYSSPLTVNQLAEECHLSEKYFGTLFKENLGKSMNQFLMEVRLDAAKELLIRTAFSIEEISYKVGFDTVYYFSNCFKKNTGMSPSVYRQAYTRE